MSRISRMSRMSVSYGAGSEAPGRRPPARRARPGRRLLTTVAVAAGSLALAWTGACPAVGAPLAGPPVAVAGPGDLLGAYQSNLEALRRFGMDPFLFPTGAAFCDDTSTLGIVPAVAGAVPGPWPKTTVAVPGLDLTAVQAGRTMFTFVPYGIGAESAAVGDPEATAGMRVAWFNLDNGRGGITPMGPIGAVFAGMVPAQVPAALRPAAEQAIQDFFLTALPVGGVRAVPVDTGEGTVLAAVFGSVRNGEKSCWFMPTVGVTTVP